VPGGDGRDRGSFEDPAAGVRVREALERAPRLGPGRGGDEHRGIGQPAGDGQLVSAGTGRHDEQPAHRPGIVPAVPLASSFTDSLGLIVVFAVVFPALVTGLIVFIIAQVLGERRENRNARYDRPQNE
jgi:hypothetical protein